MRSGGKRLGFGLLPFARIIFPPKNPILRGPVQKVRRSFDRRGRITHAAVLPPATALRSIPLAMCAVTTCAWCRCLPSQAHKQRSCAASIPEASAAAAQGAESIPITPAPVYRKSIHRAYLGAFSLDSKNRFFWRNQKKWFLMPSCRAGKPYLNSGQGSVHLPYGSPTGTKKARSGVERASSVSVIPPRSCNSTPAGLPPAG